MPPATAISTFTGFDHFMDPRGGIQDKESWFADFKKSTLKLPTPTTAAHSMVTNPSYYLTKWALGNVVTAASHALDSYDKDTAQTAASVFVLLSVFIDILGTQNGYAAIMQRNQYLESLRELATAVQKGNLSNFDLSKLTARCANNLLTAETLPDWSEFIPKIGTDAVAGINSLIQQVNTYINIASTRSTTEELGDVLTHEQDHWHVAQKTSELTNPKEIPGNQVLTGKSNGFEADVKNLSDFSIATNSIGIATAGANVARGIAELVRTSRIAKSLNAKSQIIEKGIDGLKGEAGTAILKHAGESIKHRKSANFWARVGAFFRILNGAWGLASKIVFFVLGAVIAPWVAPFVAVVVLLAYAFKNWMQARCTRLANRLDHLLANTIHVLSQKGSEAYAKLQQPELVKELKALAKGGKELLKFLKSMGRSDLFGEVRSLLKGASSIRERFPVIKQVIDICLTPIDIVHQALAKSKKAIDAQDIARISAAHSENNADPETLDGDEQDLDDEPLEHPASPIEFSAEQKKSFKNSCVAAWKRPSFHMLPASWWVGVFLQATRRLSKQWLPKPSRHKGETRLKRCCC